MAIHARRPAGSRCQEPLGGERFPLRIVRYDLAGDGSSCGASFAGGDGSWTLGATVDLSSVRSFSEGVLDDENFLKDM